MLAGIDLGGTQVRVAMASSDGKIVAATRTRTAGLGTPDQLVDWMAAEIERLRRGHRLHAAAIGAPGPIDSARGLLVNPPNLPWRNLPLGKMLQSVIGAPVYLENDAHLAGLGEYRHGAGRGSRTLVYITWSTGVGGGIIADGKLVTGAHGSAAEVGHMIVDPNGPLDGCGQRGCLEAFCGGNMLARQTGHDAASLFSAAARGDPEARMVVGRAARYMGLALISLTNLIDPEVIVIGGGVTHSWKLVQPAMLETLRSSPFITARRRPRLRRARLGDRAGQIGAVEWARQHL
ncbi:MAG TPA: ROK family protein [Candidatus Acidoferrales bacterium]|nr:ROK family protein [Candidatus Acidoferrales bacterium]